MGSPRVAEGDEVLQGKVRKGRRGKDMVVGDVWEGKGGRGEKISWFGWQPFTLSFIGSVTAAK